MNPSGLPQIKLLLLDVDGVLTSGHIIYSNTDVETKAFNVKDGLGIKLLMNAGIQVGIVTGRSSKALLWRCKDLGITLIYDGIKEKGALLETILEKTGLSSHEVAFAGDDLPDIPLLKKVGVSMTVADAHEFVKNSADIISCKNGGDGAVRELCEMILKAKGLWDSILENCI